MSYISKTRACVLGSINNIQATGFPLPIDRLEFAELVFTRSGRNHSEDIFKNFSGDLTSLGSEEL